jgi:hypothetical protein
MKSVVVKVLIIFVILLGLFTGQTFRGAEGIAQSKEPLPALAHLTKFVGKYPSFEFDKTGNNIIKGNSLIDDKAFRQVLLKTLGKERFNIFISDLDVEHPIKQNGQIIYFFKCMPHNCLSFQSHIFINLSDNSIEVYWHNSNDKQDYWLSSKKGSRGIPKDNYSWKLKSGDSLKLFNEFGNH